MNTLLIIASETKNFLLVLVWILLFVTTLTVVLVKHPVHCILSLVLVFIEAGFFLLSLNLDYLAFVFLIV
jgi:NADH:ubiquinone oxidoreductase subunit 6 (subunit J)